MTSEEVTFLLSTGLQRVSACGGDESENITVHEVPLTEIDAWIQNRAAEGLKVAATLYAGLYLARAVQ